MMFTVLFSATGFFTPSPAMAESDLYNCITCHTDLEDEVLTPPVTQWRESIHAQVGVLCADCHGGNPDDEDLAMEAESGYVGKPAHGDVPAFCSKCHSDGHLMRKYNLRTDQYSLFQGSVHGRKLAQGDESAPACTDCHGKHNILAVKDPNSSVSRKNVVETCGQCHANEKVFKKRGKPWNQLEKFKKSRHYELYSQGDLLVPTCVDCHGNHGITPAVSDRTRTVCFKCHTEQEKYYKASPHWAAYKTGGEPICLNCHNAHDILRPTVAKFTGDAENDCVECHDEKSEAYLRGVELRNIAMSTITAAHGASGNLADFQKNAHGGFEFGDLEEKLTKINEELKEMHTLTHKMNVPEVKRQSDRIIQIAEFVTGKVVSMREEIRTRNLGLVVALIVFIGFTVALVLKSRLIEKDRED